jgi:hypothetical protein
MSLPAAKRQYNNYGKNARLLRKAEEAERQ